MIRRLVHNTRETGQGQWRMNAQCASSHPARAAENGASPPLSSERSTGPLHSQRLRRPGHRKSDPGASRPTPSSAAADPPGIRHRKDRHIQAGGQDGLQERGRGHPGFLARVRKGPPPSAEFERSEGCPVEETQRRETVKGISGLRRELSRTAGPVHARLWWISAHRLPVYASPGPLPDQTQDSVPATRWLAGRDSAGELAYP